MFLNEMATNNQSSIKKNFAYKSALTISTYIMNFITFPYVSRVLGVDKIGLVSFVDNAVNYFLLFATMGVAILGVREIATVKEDRNKCNRVYSNILGMNILFTIITLIIYFVFIIFVTDFNRYKELFYVGGAKILFTAFLVEWYFTGIENFRYITIRSLLIKLLYVVAVFILIRTEDDYTLYFVLTVLVVIINAIINMVYIRKFVNLIKHELFSKKYIKQNLSLGIYSIMTSMYLTFNVMFLGFCSTNTEVGYYTTAFKLYSVILGLFTAFTNVMLPRMSSLLAGGEKEKFQNLIDKSFEAMCTFSIPMILCSIILAPQIIYILSGPGYEGAITPMRIIMPAVLFVGIAQVLAVQILTPMHKDKILLSASIIGASASIFINLTIVSSYQSIGSSIVLLCSEFIVTLVYIIYVGYMSIIKIPFNILLKNILYSLPCGILCSFCIHLFNNVILIVLSSVILVSIYLVIIHIKFKTFIGNSVLNIIKRNE